jgi:vacuolar-type H+-ATPase subunit H
MTGSTALAEIRRLELEVAQQLEAARAAATAQLEAAQQHAAEVMADAAADGRRRADEHYAQTLEEAGARAAEIRRHGAARAERVVARAAPLIPEAADGVVGLVLAPPLERGA